ncbi:hypothetical protein AB0F18_05560 [Streptomyces sp. NPDC029216]|uniref:hypothetical protein n=1 Tax=Streptomyces sp. NPDC029216 TaxID=3154701 RepID=UPI0033C2AFDF
MEQNIARHHGSAWSVSVLGHVDGTREEALAALRARADAFDRTATATAPKPPSPPRPPATPREADIAERPDWLGRDDLA